VRLLQAGGGLQTPKNDAYDLAVEAAAGVTLDLHGLAQALYPKRVDYLGDARGHMRSVLDLLPEESAFFRLLRVLRVE
jgi:hypothetical protein